MFGAVFALVQQLELTARNSVRIGSISPAKEATDETEGASARLCPLPTHSQQLRPEWRALRELECKSDEFQRVLLRKEPFTQAMLLEVMEFAQADHPFV